MQHSRKLRSIIFRGFRSRFCQSPFSVAAPKSLCRTLQPCSFPHGQHGLAAILRDTRTDEPNIDPKAAHTGIRTLRQSGLFARPSPLKSCAAVRVIPIDALILRSACARVRAEPRFAWKEYRAGVYRGLGAVTAAGVAGWPIISFVANNAQALKSFVEETLHNSTLIKIIEVISKVGAVQ
jgi:hypothetical protein